MDLLTWPDGPENPKIFKRFYSESAYEWYYGVNPVIRLKANPLTPTRRATQKCGSPSRHLNGARKSVGVHHPNTRGIATSVAVHHPTSRGQAKA